MADHDAAELSPAQQGCEQARTKAAEPCTCLPVLCESQVLHSGQGPAVELHCDAESQAGALAAGVVRDTEKRRRLTSAPFVQMQQPEQVCGERCMCMTVLSHLHHQPCLLLASMHKIWSALRRQ